MEYTQLTFLEITLYVVLCCPQSTRRGRFSPFNRRIFKPRAFRFPCAQAHRRGVPVPPVLSGRFRRPLSTIAPSSSAAVWPARSLVPSVGLENKPASQCVTHKFFFLVLRGRSVRFYAVAGVEPRPAVRCGLNRWRGAVEPRPPVWPAPVFGCVGIWGAGLRIASPSLAMYANGGNASRFGSGGGYSAPQPPKISKDFGRLAKHNKARFGVRMAFYQAPRIKYKPGF